MSKKQESPKAFYIILFFGVLVVIGFVAILAGGGSSDASAVTPSDTNNATTVDSSGAQILNLTAKAGYSPSVLTAKAGQEINLKVTTKSSFDCSTAFMIPKFNISKNLPANGVTDFRIPAQAAGTTINGTCSMGMYTFKINVL